MKTLDVEYVAIVDREFNELKYIEPKKYSYSLVVARFGNTRLLDNIWLLTFCFNKEFMIKLQKKLKIKRINIWNFQ